MTQIRQRAKRQTIDYGAMIYSPQGEKLVPCRLRNASDTGAQLVLQEDVALPKSFILALSRSGEVKRKCGLVWQLDLVAGVKFQDRT